MKLEPTNIKLQYNNHDHMYYCDRVQIVNEHVFDTITDVDVIIEASEAKYEGFIVKLHDVRCFDMEHERVEVDTEAMKRIELEIHKAINLIK